MQKAMQLVALIIQVISTLGLATFAQKWTGTHLDAIIVINLVLTVGHAILPSVIPAPIAPNKKQLGLFLILLALPVSMRAQVATLPNAPKPANNIYAAGVSYNQAGTPQIAGTALYAHVVDATTGTYAFTALDALPTSTKPFTVTTNIGAGISQKIFTIGNTVIFAPVATGFSFTGSNSGWQWNGGLLASIPYRKINLMPNVRFLKSSVSNGSGYQPIAGLLIGLAN